jgi:DNA-binding CsgD family transcriptional regulator
MTDREARLLAYVRAAKQAEAVAGHQGHSAEDDSFHMGKAAAYQDIENLLTANRRHDHATGENTGPQDAPATQRP